MYLKLLISIFRFAQAGLVFVAKIMEHVIAYSVLTGLPACQLSKMALFFDIGEREATQFYQSGKAIIELHVSMCLLEWIYN